MDWTALSYLVTLGLGLWVGHKVGRDTVIQALKDAEKRELDEIANLTDEEVDARFKAKIDDLQRSWDNVRMLRGMLLERLNLWRIQEIERSRGGKAEGWDDDIERC